MADTSCSWDGFNGLSFAFITITTLFSNHTLADTGIFRNPGHTSLQAIFDGPGCYSRLRSRVGVREFLTR